MMSGRLRLRLDYQPPGETLQAFRQSDAVARAVIGPMGAGRKIAVLHDIVIRAFPADQVHHRWIIAAASADQVMQVIDRVNEWVPPGVGDWDDKTWRRQLKLGDGNTTARVFDFQFLALDRPEHRRRFGSAETTGFWLVAARDLDEAIFQTALERAGTWPSGFDGGGRKQVIATSRMPRSDHWLMTRSDVALFRQPGGRTAEAENVEPRGGLKRGSYERAAQGMDPARVATEIDAEFARKPDEEFLDVSPARVALAAFWALQPDGAPKVLPVAASSGARFEGHSGASTGDEQSE
jgi:hypothetical protein